MFRYQPVFGDYSDQTPAVFRERWAGPYGKFLAVPENFFMCLLEKLSKC